jgi:hypothetical protein
MAPKPDSLSTCYYVRVPTLGNELQFYKVVYESNCDGKILLFTSFVVP